MLKSVKRDILLCEKMHVPMRHIGILCVQQYLVHNGANIFMELQFFFSKFDSLRDFSGTIYRTVGYFFSLILAEYSTLCRSYGSIHFKQPKNTD